jgi:hypothetical protein
MRLRTIGIRVGLVLLSLPAMSLGAYLGIQGRNRATDSGSARAAAPKDLTGYWVSVVTEDWRWRMLVPDKGDWVGTPLTPEGIKAAQTWDPAKDQADGNQCRSYGAPVIMRVPGRLHIYWQDDNTLRIDADSGTQTRLLHFGGSMPTSEEPSWQGYSIASWEGKAPAYLKVVTTRLRSGYLRKNGVPYGANASLEEYVDRFMDPYRGNTYLIVTSVVTDPQYLTQPFMVTAHFKKIPDASGWDPTPCRVDQPR